MIGLIRFRIVFKSGLILIFFLEALGLARPAQAVSLDQRLSHPAEHRVLTAEFGCDKPVRVLPLGDSITRGSSSGTAVDPQYYISYRRDLYRSLSAKGYRVNFVGSQENDGSYYADFDRDHEGWPGKSDDYIAKNIYNWLTKNPADIILLHIGTNDVNPESPDTSAADVKEILKEIDRFNPGIWVIVARIIQRVPYDSNTAAFNRNVDGMLTDRIRAGDKILKVDLENGSYMVYALYPDGDMYDEKHPYASGYVKMAVKWEEALASLLPRCGCSLDPAVPGGGCVRSIFLPLVGYSASR